MNEQPVYIEPIEKHCSEYDEECWLVANKIACFMGNKDVSIADGFCPFIHNAN